jgi:hypothetical protein
MFIKINFHCSNYSAALLQYMHSNNKRQTHISDRHGVATTSHSISITFCHIPLYDLKIAREHFLVFLLLWLSKFST